MKSAIRVNDRKKLVNKKNQKTQLSSKKTKKLFEGCVFLKKYFNKVNITYLFLLFLDIFVVIYFARQNKVNYVVFLDEKIFVSETRYLLWGRNYINIIIIAFFYGYICLVNKFLLGKKNTKKFLLCLLVCLVFINALLFIMFTTKIY